MARLGRIGFLGTAIVFHLVYIYSIFDIYFVSPLVHGMRAYKVDTPEPPARRLILYVGDGLRADKAFQFFPDPSRPIDDSAAQDVVPMAPFLRSRVLEHGTFGVSHTRVPTESRPGHVALIAGLYEDVAAVTTGWKLNSVNFDSVFNRSRHTWSWGSPDILPMFSAGAVPGRVEDQMYEAEFEDSSKDATELDYWVFDRVKKLFEDADTDERHDVAQADIAALMAYLVGLEFPVNSVGELPLSFLDATDEQKAKALLANAREILEMYCVKEREKMAEVLHYKPYSGFAETNIENRLAFIEELIREQDYTTAMKQSDELIKTALQGLRYLQTYAWLFLRTLVTAGYLGWIAFAFTTAIDVYVLDNKINVQRSRGLVITFTSILVGLCSLLMFQASPITYYAYAFFPLLFWEEVFARWRVLAEGKRILFSQFSMKVMVQSYYRRQVYTIVYLTATAWPLLNGTDFVKTNIFLYTTWALSCAAMSVFTLLPANKLEDITLISVGGILILLVGFLYIAFEERLLVQTVPSKHRLSAADADGVSRMILGLQVGLVALAMLVTRSSVASLQTKQGLPLGTQIAGWATLVASLVLPFAHVLRPRKHFLHRHMIIFLALGPLFIILTISYEGLFYFAIAITLFSWVQLEHRIHQHSKNGKTRKIKSIDDSRTTGNAKNAAVIDKPFKKALKEEVLAPLTTAAETAEQREAAAAEGSYRSLILSDVRLCLFFLFLLHSAFFSTGNIASVSSFSLDAVYRLVPIFDPFSQAALLIFKILAPFALVSANLGFLTKRLKLQGGSLFTVVMGLGDYMTLRFFWAVRDEGSWLEIGESISMFIIASALCVFVAALEALSEVFVRGVEFQDNL
ncbi:Phosphatidylinositolglycan class N-domain-containing protein [Penicillium antarcticum]|uniref:Phosphatidylinositolglycan class N-domain-containing protein n=1 Tax=Penicillium antarcticum TaxID=416450 RepID=UPI002384B030|nr:Phosphatidylinositolglycan class N-domain-containing protein [Penicillium antarcticum]KAJ5317398.1 Phosphatidylinositolglycan class N-domain-containing protein [Penicillium antarcticum]